MYCTTAMILGGHWAAWIALVIIGSTVNKGFDFCCLHPPTPPHTHSLSFAQATHMHKSSLAVSVSDNRNTHAVGCYVYFNKPTQLCCDSIFAIIWSTVRQAVPARCFDQQNGKLPARDSRGYCSESSLQTLNPHELWWPLVMMNHKQKHLQVAQANEILQTSKILQTKKS